MEPYLRGGGNPLKRTAPLLLLAFWLVWRFWTLAAMPSAPDPREALIAEDALRVLAGESPERFHWPGTPWTFLAAGMPLLLGAEDAAGLARIMRIASLLFGACCLFLSYRMARRVSRFPLTAPLLLALAPAFSSGEANVGLADMPSLAFGLAALLAAFSTDRFTFLRSFWIGALIGFGAAFKLPCALHLFPAAALIALGGGSLRRKALPLLAAPLGAALAFLAGCPYLLLDFPAVWGGLRYELSHYRAGHFGLFPTADDGVFSAPLRHANALSWAAGPLLAACLASAFCALCFLAAKNRRFEEPERAALVVWALAALLPIALHRFSFTRHWLTALPPLTLIAAALLGTSRRRVVWFPFALAGLHSLLMTGALELQTRQPSTAARCADWIAESGLAVSSGPSEPLLWWLYPPGLSSGGGADAFVFAVPEARLQRRAAEDPGAFREADFFPLSRAYFTAGPFHARLSDSDAYRLEARFAPRVSFWMRSAAFFGREPPFPLNALFHPELRIYRAVPP